MGEIDMIERLETKDIFKLDPIGNSIRVTGDQIYAD